MNPAQRKALYIGGALAGGLLFAFGILTPEFIDKVIEGVGLVVAAYFTFTSIVAFKNVP